MMADNAPRHALVFGGSGAVGGAVVAALAARGCRVTFTVHRAEARAVEVARETGARMERVDLASASDVTAFVSGLCKGDDAPSVFIHAAGVAGPKTLDALDIREWDAMMAVNCRAALISSRILAGSMGERGGGDIVLVGALDRGQSLPMPVGFAACQGTLAAMAMALAKELGPKGVRVNMTALGLLDQGLGTALDPALREAYLKHSALHRFGTPAEAAKVIVWLALDNRYMSGKVVPVSGGI